MQLASPQSDYAALQALIARVEEHSNRRQLVASSAPATASASASASAASADDDAFNLSVASLREHVSAHSWRIDELQVEQHSLLRPNDRSSSTYVPHPFHHLARHRFYHHQSALAASLSRLNVRVPGLGLTAPKSEKRYFKGNRLVSDFTTVNEYEETLRVLREDQGHNGSVDVDGSVIPDPEFIAFVEETKAREEKEQHTQRRGAKRTRDTANPQAPVVTHNTIAIDTLDDDDIIMLSQAPIAKAASAKAAASIASSGVLDDIMRAPYSTSSSASSTPSASHDSSRRSSFSFDPAQVLQFPEFDEEKPIEHQQPQDVDITMSQLAAFGVDEPPEPEEKGDTKAALDEESMKEDVPTGMVIAEKDTAASPKVAPASLANVTTSPLFSLLSPIVAASTSPALAAQLLDMRAKIVSKLSNGATTLTIEQVFHTTLMTSNITSISATGLLAPLRSQSRLASVMSLLREMMTGLESWRTASNADFDAALIAFDLASLTLPIFYLVVVGLLLDANMMSSRVHQILKTGLLTRLLELHQQPGSTLNLTMSRLLSFLVRFHESTLVPAVLLPWIYDLPFSSPKMSVSHTLLQELMTQPAAAASSSSNAKITPLTSNARIQLFGAVCISHLRAYHLQLMSDVARGPLFEISDYTLLLLTKKVFFSSSSLPPLPPLSSDEDHLTLLRLLSQPPRDHARFLSSFIPPPSSSLVSNPILASNPTFVYLVCLTLIALHPTLRIDARYVKLLTVYAQDYENAHQFSSHPNLVKLLIEITTRIGEPALQTKLEALKQN